MIRTFESYNPENMSGFTTDFDGVVARSYGFASYNPEANRCYHSISGIDTEPYINYIKGDRRD